MTRLRDDDLVRPSHAAILRQRRAAEASLAEPAHIGAALPVGSYDPHAPEPENHREPRCWIVSDLEEPLRYI